MMEASANIYFAKYDNEQILSISAAIRFWFITIVSKSMDQFINA